MESSSLFAHMPSSPDAIVARVRTDLERFAADVGNPPGIDPARVADEAVRRLWESRVKVFIPVLAFREARERLLASNRWSGVTLASISAEPVTASAAVNPRVLRPRETVWPWAGAAVVTGLGWPLGAVLVDHPWLGMALAGWMGLFTALWNETRTAC